MTIELGILTLCLLFGLMLMRISWVKLRNKQFIRCWISFSFSTSLLLISSLFVTFIFDYTTYQRLTLEHPVASIKFHSLGEHHYQGVLIEANHKPLFFELHGDQWQIDGRLMKWTGAAEWSGLKPMYRLERLGGRYQDIEMEKNATRSLYSLEQGLSPTLWSFLVEYQAFIPWLDAYYGSATYLPMSHGAEFTISISASGLIARPENAAAKLSIQNWLF